MAKEKRFIRTWTDGAMSGTEIWVDRQTGVNYLYHTAGYGGGMTVLVDENGRPIVTPITEETEE